MNITQKLIELNDAIEAERIRHEEEVEKIHKLKLRIQQECDHKKIDKYYGPYESMIWCGICGKDLT